jgi:hypothetical protein
MFTLFGALEQTKGQATMEMDMVAGSIMDVAFCKCVRRKGLTRSNEAISLRR